MSRLRPLLVLALLAVPLVIAYLRSRPPSLTPDEWLARGQQAVRGHDVREAERVASQLRDDGQPAHAALLMGEIHYRRKQFNRAEQELARIDGESPHDKHKGEIDVESWTWGETRPAPPVGGTGAGAGKVTMQDFTFTMKFNKASPKLFLACAKGEHIKSAWLTAHRGGPKDQGYFLKWSFADVIISSYLTGAGGGEGWWRRLVRG